MRVTHPFEPVYDENSRILILGSLPSVRSRADGFYYGHPRNRFWNMMADVLCEDVPHTVEQKKELLIRNGIALWDVIYSCDIEGSSDATIRNIEPTDVKSLLACAPIRGIICNGQTAGKLYRRFHQASIGLPVLVLPSTSPANAAWDLQKLIGTWKAAIDEVREKHAQQT